MSAGGAMDLGDLCEWLEAVGLGLSLEGASSSDAEGAVREKLRDGITLCHLVNKIKPGSVENIKPKRSSGDAEENILRFLQACTTVGVKKIFRPSDLLDRQRDFSSVLVTLQQLYSKAAALGMGVQFSRLLPKKPHQNGTGGAVSSDSSPMEEGEEEGEGEGEKIVRAVYAFHGSNGDELQFDKGDLITVVKVVDGGWWEGVCNGRVGWFPGNYVEEVEESTTQDDMEGADSPHHYHKLVVKDILDSEKTFVQDLHSLLSNYLAPLESANVVSVKEVEHLTGNLSELIRWQQLFLKSLEDCSKLQVSQQLMGSIFLKAAQEMEGIYTSYCANHPKAVAALTENSDKLSAFMESKGAASPGLLALTSNLSKPFRRLEKYPALLKELNRHISEGHKDAEHVATAIDTYNAISVRTQDVRKRKEMEHEMLTNPVQGFSGQCLNELGECACVIQANQALNSEEVEERFFLVFPTSFVILAVGQSLSGYELKANFPLSSLSVKKAAHSEQWPHPVEVTHKQETIHASLYSERDQTTLTECTGGLEQAVSKVPQRTGSVGSSRAVSMAGSRPGSIFRSAYPARAMRRTSVPIKRARVWGFKSLRPLPSMHCQRLMSLREVKSPRGAKKFIYPAGKKKRSSKSIDEALSTSSSRASAHPIDKPGDRAILSVIEAYCAVGRGTPLTDDHLTRLTGPMDTQVRQLHLEVVNLRETLQQEITARVSLESRFDYFADRLGPIVLSPSPK